MGKIICEICGTVYPDSAECCPICGYSRDLGGFSDHASYSDPQPEGAASYDTTDTEGFDLNSYEGYEENAAGYGEPSYEEPSYEQPSYENQGYEDPGYASYDSPEYSQPQQPRRQIFDYDAVNPRENRTTGEAYRDVRNDVTLNDYPQDSYDNYDYYGQGRQKSHTGLIIFLVVLILALMAASGFLLIKFILPNLNPTEPPVMETYPTAMLTTAPTTEPTIPCESLVLVEGGSVELSREGQFYLIHASVSPEDTTDALVYQSEDESVVTVDGDGKITAVGEGETQITLTCGSQILRLPVSVRYQEETEATEATAVSEEAGTEETAENAEAKDTDTEETGSMAGDVIPEETENEETVPETTEDDGLKKVDLKLKKTDLMSGVQGVSFRLELDCDLTAEEVEWSSTDIRVATVKNGVVTTVGHGTCKIIAKYGAQEVSCVIRCTF